MDSKVPLRSNFIFEATFLILGTIDIFNIFIRFKTSLRLELKPDWGFETTSTECKRKPKLINYFFSNIKKTQYKLLFGDIVLIMLSLVISYSIKIFMDKGQMSIFLIFYRFHWLTLTFFIIHPLTLYIMGFYSPYLKQSYKAFEK